MPDLTDAQIIAAVRFWLLTRVGTHATVGELVRGLDQSHFLIYRALQGELSEAREEAADA